MSRLRYNGLSATLGAELSIGATSISFAAPLTHSGGVPVPTITGSNYFVLSLLSSSGRLAEIIYVTAYTAGASTATITRGKEGTAALTHSAGARIAQAPTTSDQNPIGTVLMFLGNSADIPLDYLLLDGTIFDSNVYPLLATQLGGNILPDARDRHPRGATGAFAVGSLSGSDTISILNLPDHYHSLPIRFIDNRSAGGLNVSITDIDNQTGSGGGTTYTAVSSTVKNSSGGSPGTLGQPYRPKSIDFHYIVKAR